MEAQTSGKFPAGSKWEYSNSGYAVLAMTVGKVSGKPFGQFQQERIFTPLGMKHTLAYEKGKNEVPHRAYGHTKEDDGFPETDQNPTSAVLGDGGIYSSLDDLARWDRALRDHTLLSEAEMQPALTAVSPADGPAITRSGRRGGRRVKQCLRRKGKVAWLCLCFRGAQYGARHVRALYGVGATGGALEGAAGATAAASPSLTRSFNSLLGLKNGIFLAGTSTPPPALGLLPTRVLPCRVRIT